MRCDGTAFHGLAEKGNGFCRIAFFQIFHAERMQGGGLVFRGGLAHPAPCQRRIFCGAASRPVTLGQFVHGVRIAPFRRLPVPEERLLHVARRAVAGFIRDGEVESAEGASCPGSLLKERQCLPIVSGGAHALDVAVAEHVFAVEVAFRSCALKPEKGLVRISVFFKPYPPVVRLFLRLKAVNRPCQQNAADQTGKQQD